MFEFHDDFIQRFFARVDNGFKLAPFPDRLAPGSRPFNQLSARRFFIHAEIVQSNFQPGRKLALFGAIAGSPSGMRRNNPHLRQRSRLSFSSLGRLTLSSAAILKRRIRMWRFSGSPVVEDESAAGGCGASRIWRRRTGKWSWHILGAEKNWIKNKKRSEKREGSNSHGMVANG